MTIFDHETPTLTKLLLNGKYNMIKLECLAPLAFIESKRLIVECGLEVREREEQEQSKSNNYSFKFNAF